MARDPLHAPIHAKPQKHELPNFDAMTDDELMVFFASRETDNVYHVPHGFEPDGMSYGWKRVEVLGQPDYSNLSECEHGGWAAVPQERHDGFWMTPGTKGPTIVKGLMLMEISSRVLRVKEKIRDGLASAPIEGINDRLSYNKPTSAPRIEAQVRRTPYAGPVEFEVQN